MLDDFLMKERSGRGLGGVPWSGQEVYWYWTTTRVPRVQQRFTGTGLPHGYLEYSRGVLDYHTGT